MHLDVSKETNTFNDNVFRKSQYVEMDLRVLKTYSRSEETASFHPNKMETTRLHGVDISSRNLSSQFDSFMCASCSVLGEGLTILDLNSSFCELPMCICLRKI